MAGPSEEQLEPALGAGAPAAGAPAAGDPAAGDPEADRRRLLVVRAARGFSDGLVGVVLPAHLLLLGFSATQVGVVAMLSLAGSAAVTFSLPFLARTWSRRRLLLVAALMMAATGAGLAGVTALPAVALVAFLGTVNPSGGDVSLFVPVEQAALSQTTADRHRTSRFAHYVLVGSLATAVGSLAAGGPERLVALIARLRGWSAVPELAPTRATFVFYGLVGLGIFAVHRRLTVAVEAPAGPGGGLHRSRAIVLRLTALFAVDSFGSGFANQSILVLWLFLRFEVSTASAGLILFWSGLATSASILAAPVVARRVGLIRTMAFTHIPANLFLVAAALAPRLEVAVPLLLARGLLSTMDVPARTSYLMAVVAPEERTAAAAVTGVARSLAAVPGPVLAGLLLDAGHLGIPLVVAGAIKTAYDLALLVVFGRVPAPEEAVRA